MEVGASIRIAVFSNVDVWSRAAALSARVQAAICSTLPRNRFSVERACYSVVRRLGRERAAASPSAELLKVGRKLLATQVRGLGILCKPRVPTFLSTYNAHSLIFDLSSSAHAISASASARPRPALDLKLQPSVARLLSLPDYITRNAALITDLRGFHVEFVTKLGPVALPLSLLRFTSSFQLL